MILGFDYASVGGYRPDFSRARTAIPEFAFVMIRAAYGTWPDPCWPRDRPAAHAAGVVPGAYLFLRWDKAPVPQAETLCRAVGSVGAGELPPVIDVEFPRGRVATGLSVVDVLERINAAVECVESALGCCMIYTSSRVWYDDLGGGRALLAARCPLWVKTPYPYRAREPLHLVTGRWSVPTPWQAAGAAPVVMEQFQGDAIGVAGFPGTVDVSRFVVPSASAPWIAARLGGLSTSEFQTKRGLVADGVIGPRTFAALAAVRAPADAGRRTVP